MSQKHKILTRKNPDYRKNDHHYQNWIDLRRQVKTHTNILKRDHVITLRHKLMSLKKEENRSQFEINMFELILHTINLFYFPINTYSQQFKNEIQKLEDGNKVCIENIYGQEKITLEMFLNIVEYKSTNIETKMLQDMWIISLQFQLSRISSPLLDSKSFLKEYEELCDKFTEQDKEFGHYRYNRWHFQI